MREALHAIWYQGRRPGPPLIALSWLYRLLRWLAVLPWRLGLRRPASLAVPVVVVGNLSVGGTGKTPLVIALAKGLRERGLRVGVISRGYGRRSKGVRLVMQDSDAAEVGDEPLLIAAASGAPVVVGEKRVLAARRLLGAVPVDVLLADDGLEHHALPRCMEIVVVDAERGFGNRRLLPAGPLRAPLARLRQVDCVVYNGGPEQEGRMRMQLRPRAMRGLVDGLRGALEPWQGRRVHALAGIGHPQRFFATLRELGIDPVEHPRPDHADYQRDPPPHSEDGLPWITTAKDAVKLGKRSGWYVLEVEAELPPGLLDQLLERIGHPELCDHRKAVPDSSQAPS